MIHLSSPLDVVLNAYFRMNRVVKRAVYGDPKVVELERLVSQLLSFNYDIVVDLIEAETYIKELESELAYGKNYDL